MPKSRAWRKRSAMRIRLNKEFYGASAMKKARKDFKEAVTVSDEKEYYIIESDDRKALLEFANYVIANR